VNLYVKRGHFRLSKREFPVAIDPCREM